MDAPPDKEALGPFLQVARSFEAIGLNVPHIHAEDLVQGFLLLEDLGSTLYLDHLNAESAERLYGDALGALATIRPAGRGKDCRPMIVNCCCGRWSCSANGCSKANSP